MDDFFDNCLLLVEVEGPGVAFAMMSIERVWGDDGAGMNFPERLSSI